MFDAEEYYPSKEEIKKRAKLTNLWLNYYSNWDGSFIKRDNVIRRKVNSLKTPPIL